MAKRSKKHPNPLTEVTPLSKTIAAVLFITLPLLAFAIGANYQATVDAELCGMDTAISIVQ